MDDKEVIIQIEKSLWKKGYKNVAGVDEAGRGPLAGPVVASVVIFPLNVNPFLFKDSKKLNERERKRFFYRILEEAKAVGVGFADSTEIDEINIYQATLLAIRRALSSISIKPDFLITDYIKLPEYSNSILPIPKGDERSFSCACASVVSKVVRDYIMEELSKLFPEYGFEKHKGYPTKFHILKIRELGITPIHRRSFGRVKGEREGRGKNSFPLSCEERLLYYREKLQELLR
ncbi:RNase HII [Balnearium lithotrophicum]|uniref:Ribonuclease HII n=1 Tax=Balnearium lithotrophicum TaxID=223788 RepID=A0A521DQL8_9BACT|nr:ribonuclease HII [Balnearium lithotrophicum]SMO73401.1 RNase HII [Balnearium lithotrophicum]